MVAKESEHNIILRLGDPGGDGHDKTCEFNYVCNKNKKEIFSAYKKGAKKIGFDFINAVSTEYRDRVISEKYLKKLEKAGFDIFRLEDIEEDYSEGVSLTEEDYVNIFLFFVGVGDPSITYEGLNHEVMDIGGYGLFY